MLKMFLNKNFLAFVRKRFCEYNFLLYGEYLLEAQILSFENTFERFTFAYIQLSQNKFPKQTFLALVTSWNNKARGVFFGGILKRQLKLRQWDEDYKKQSILLNRTCMEHIVIACGRAHRRLNWQLGEWIFFSLNWFDYKNWGSRYIFLFNFLGFFLLYKILFKVF